MAAGTTRSIGPLLEVEGAAAHLNCGRRLIYRLVAERRVRFTYAGRSLRFWQYDLNVYLDDRTVEPLVTRR